MILVIGSNCFSGAHFVNHCLTRMMRLWALVDLLNMPPHTCLTAGTEYAQDRFSFYKLDLNQ